MIESSDKEKKVKIKIDSDMTQYVFKPSPVCE